MNFVKNSVQEFGGFTGPRGGWRLSRHSSRRKSWSRTSPMIGWPVSCAIWPTTRTWEVIETQLGQRLRPAHRARTRRADDASGAGDPARAPGARAGRTPHSAAGAGPAARPRSGAPPPSPPPSSPGGLSFRAVFGSMFPCASVPGRLLAPVCPPEKETTWAPDAPLLSGPYATGTFWEKSPETRLEPLPIHRHPRPSTAIVHNGVNFSQFRLKVAFIRAPDRNMADFTARPRKFAVYVEMHSGDFQ